MKKRLLSLLLVVAMLSAASCGSGNDNEKDSETATGTETQAGTQTETETDAATDTEAPVVELQTIVGEGASDYRIVYAEEPDSMELIAAQQLAAAITEATGVSLAIATDDSEATAFEIIVGETNRAPINETLSERDFAITFEGDKVILAAGSGTALDQAVEYFVANYVDAEQKTVALPVDLAYTFAYDYYFGEITVDGVSLPDYTIVLPENATLIETSAAYALNDYLLANANFALEIVDDTAAQGAHEILIGATSRAQSAKYDDLTYGELEYLLDAEDGHIVMRGEGYALGAAIGAFTALITPEEAGTDAWVTVPADDAVATFVFPETAKNGLLLIGDGMGFKHIEMTIAKGLLERFVANDLPHQGEATTYSADEEITDSAAAGTALATGSKTNNGMVGLAPDGEVLTNIREIAAAAGASTAVLSTDDMDGATPGAFTVHVPDRDDDEVILPQIYALDDIDYYHVDPDSVYEELDVTDMFVDASRQGLRVVSNLNNEDFFVMIEESWIDEFSHKRQTDNAAAMVCRFDSVIAYATQFVFIHPETALVITADHETGGLTELRPGLWHCTSNEHTAQNVPVFAFGPQTEMFNGATVDNTEIAKFFGRIWGVEDLGA